MGLLGVRRRRAARGALGSGVGAGLPRRDGHPPQRAAVLAGGPLGHRVRSAPARGSGEGRGRVERRRGSSDAEERRRDDRRAARRQEGREETGERQARDRRSRHLALARPTTPHAAARRGAARPRPLVPRRPARSRAHVRAARRRRSSRGHPRRGRPLRHRPRSPSLRARRHARRSPLSGRVGDRPTHRRALPGRREAALVLRRQPAGRSRPLLSRSRVLELRPGGPRGAQPDRRTRRPASSTRKATSTRSIRR